MTFVLPYLNPLSFMQASDTILFPGSFKHCCHASHATLPETPGLCHILEGPTWTIGLEDA